MNIIILSRNPKLYSTKRLVEAAEQKGHNVRVIDHLKCNIDTIVKSHFAYSYNFWNKSYKN